MLSKTDYIHYLECPIHLWFRKYKPEEQEPLSVAEEWRVEQGAQVEAWARSLFPDGVLVSGHSQESAVQTQALIHDGIHTLFQATVSADGLFAMADILQLNPSTHEWEIFEVKSTTEVETEHLEDTCFQLLAFERAGFTVGKVSIIHVNGNYVRHGDVQAEGLLTMEDVTDQVRAMAPETAAKIEAAKRVAENRKMPSCDGCTCAPKECPCLAYCYPDLPEYPVFDLNRISAKKACTLYRSGVRSVLDLPQDYPCTVNQQCQLQAARTGQPIIETEAIHTALQQLEFPLCFLDYETFNPAIPLFEGYKPYQQMPFQYSLHVVQQDGSIQHHEYLAEDLTDPLPGLLQSLQSAMPETGSVIVWYRGFEEARNTEMAAMMRQYAPFLQSLNARMYDLMETFSKRHYVHPDFRGSCSIKKVLPVLVPKLTYKDLAIQEGGTASVTWYRMLTDKQTMQRKTEICQHMLDYCKLDTLAMVEVWRELMKL